jgi:hypothetical protein
MRKNVQITGLAAAEGLFIRLATDGKKCDVTGAENFGWRFRNREPVPQKLQL